MYGRGIPRDGSIQVPNKLCLLVCQNFQREVSAVIRDEGFTDVLVAAFPATCIRPSADEDLIGRRASAHIAQGCDVIALGGHCLRSLVDVNRTSPGSSGGMQVVALPRCLEFAASANLVDAQVAAGAYLLTPGWLENWRRYIGEWGFDEKTAREFFAETTRELVLLDTGIYHDSETTLREFAEFLAQPYEIIPVGLDLFRLHVIRVILERRIMQQRDAPDAVKAQVNRSSRTTPW